MKAAVYAGTRNLYLDMETAAKSLTKNSSVDVIYFFIEDDKFPHYLPPHIKTINVSNQQYFPENGPNVYKRWTYMSLMRCALTKYFPDLDKILWFDVDTIVQDNIDELWDLDMDDYYFAGVIEPGKSTPEKPYMNVGAIMINLKKLREDHMDDALIKALNTKKYTFADQDCISDICYEKFLILPSIYNLNDWTEPCENPKILHFADERDWNKRVLLYQYRNKNWSEMRPIT